MAVTASHPIAPRLVLVVLVALAAVVLPAAAFAAPSVKITKPASYQVLQRDALGTADIAVSGTYTGSPAAIEARWRSGGWVVIDAAPSGGRYAGVLPAQPAGQGRLEVRFADLTSVHVSHTTVGVGDVFVIAGQSNASGRAATNQKWQHPTLIACMYGNDRRWKVMRDPIDSVAGQPNEVSREGIPVGGSIWPLLATRIMRYQNVPVAFIPVPKGGSSVAAWRCNDAQPDDPQTLYGNMLRRVKAAASGIRAILYWGGEIDGGMLHRTGPQYLAYFEPFAGDVQRDFGVPLVEAQIGEVRWKMGTVSLNAVRVAQRETWAYDGVRSGPPLYDILLHRPDYPDEIHYITPDIMPKVAGRWWAAIRSGCYGSGDGRGPRLESAVYDDASRSILLTFTDLDLPLYLPGNVTKAFRVRDDGLTVTITGVTLVAADQLRVKLASAAVGALTISLGEGHAGALNPVPKDSSLWRMPAEMFVGEPVQRP